MQNPNAIGPEQSLDKYKRVNANPQLVMTWWAMPLGGHEMSRATRCQQDADVSMHMTRC